MALFPSSFARWMAKQDHVSLAIACFNTEDRLLFANTTFCNMLGCSLESLLEDADTKKWEQIADSDQPPNQPGEVTLLNHQGTGIQRVKACFELALAARSFRIALYLPLRSLSLMTCSKSSEMAPGEDAHSLKNFATICGQLFDAHATYLAIISRASNEIQKSCLSIQDRQKVYLPPAALDQFMVDQFASTEIVELTSLEQPNLSFLQIPKGSCLGWEFQEPDQENRVRLVFFFKTMPQLNHLPPDLMKLLAREAGRELRLATPLSVSHEPLATTKPSELSIERSRQHTQREHTANRLKSFWLRSEESLCRPTVCSGESSPVFHQDQIYKTFVEQSPQAMMIVVDDQIIFANPAAHLLLGSSENMPVLGRKFSRLIPPVLRMRFQETLFKPTPDQLNQGHHYDTFKLLRVDGFQTEVEMVVIPIIHQQKYALQIMAQDLTAQKQAADALRQSEARYALAARGANDGLWDWDLANDCVYYSQRWCSMLGLYHLGNDVSPNFWLDRVHTEDLKSLNQKLNDHLAGRTPHFEIEHRLRHEDGDFRWMHCRGVAVFDNTGKATRIAGSLRDITARKKVEHQLFHDAFHDNLTGLANRALFMEHLNRALGREQKHHEHLLAILFIDFDRFKLVNDSLGHLVGDELLIGIAKRLKAALPANDLFARLGGDEFAILVEDIQFPVEARNRAQTIHQCLNAPFFIEKNELYTSVSIGIAFGVPGLDKPVELLRDADTAMYRAKARGKAQSVVFDQAMHDEVQRVMNLENDLRKAMERNEFEVYFQPIIDLRSLELAGFEALLRWNHPTKGIVYPDEFINLAEETGIILSLGINVLRKACKVIKELHQIRNPNLFLHVNLSFRQIMHSDLTGEISSVLEETNFPAERLKLELTESVLAEPGDFAVALLNDLRQLGIRLCLDDFGTGYASLSYLHRLPIDSLKIDKSFVDRIFLGPSHKDMVPTIISLAHNMGLSVVAEGIETEAQFRRLLDLGCEFAQGFYFGKPVKAHKTKELCETNPFSAATN